MMTTPRSTSFRRPSSVVQAEIERASELRLQSIPDALRAALYLSEVILRPVYVYETKAPAGFCISVDNAVDNPMLFRWRYRATVSAPVPCDLCASLPCRCEEGAR